MEGAVEDKAVGLIHRLEMAVVSKTTFSSSANEDPLSDRNAPIHNGSALYNPGFFFTLKSRLIFSVFGYSLW